METLQIWWNFSKLGSQTALKSVDPGSRKKCKCCPVSLLIVRSQRLSWVHVQNCQNCNHLKGHNSSKLSTIVKNVKIVKKTLPEAQRTQGIDSLTWVISPAKYNATCIGSKVGQHVMQLELVPSLATRWCYLHYLQNCPPDGAICISCKFGHQMAPLH